MKKGVVVFVAVLAVFLMSCGGNGDKKTKKVTIRDKESGAEITATADQKKLPEDFPKDIYLVKGTIDNITTVSMGEQKNVSVNMLLDKSPEDVKAEIVKNMEDKGWTTKMNMGSQQYFTKGDKILRTGITEEDGKTIVTYMATY